MSAFGEAVVVVEVGVVVVDDGVVDAGVVVVVAGDVVVDAGVVVVADPEGAEAVGGELEEDVVVVPPDDDDDDDDEVESVEEPGFVVLEEVVIKPLSCSCASISR